MRDEVAFLRAIRAAPGDITARLVYADWLQDRGDPRAEWVRREAGFRAELARLDAALLTLQVGPAGQSLAQMLERVGLATEVPALMLALIEAYESATDDQRHELRALVAAHRGFCFRAWPPDAETVAGTVRRWLLRFALLDGDGDYRDAILWLGELYQTPGITPQELNDLRREMAPLASNESPHGLPSPRSLLLGQR